MTRVSYFFITLMTLALLGATSCINDDFATSPSDLLEFSTDTVAFDTVITLQGTATKQFLVYNRGKKQIKISDIRMAGEGQGHFFLNVDGQKGTEFHNIEVRGGDSIFVFVESYMDEAAQDEPLEIKDRILFETNGVTQHVTVTAWAQDVVLAPPYSFTKVPPCAAMAPSRPRAPSTSTSPGAATVWTTWWARLGSTSCRASGVASSSARAVWAMNWLLSTCAAAR